MTDLEQRIHNWTGTVTADVEPITLDEIHALADAAPIPDTSAADPEQRPRRTWLAAAAVVVLLAATLAGIALLGPDDGGVADTDLSPTMERLIKLGPESLDAEGAMFADVAAARDDAGLTPPAAGLDGSVDNFVIGLFQETGVVAAPPSAIACDLVTVYGCWTELGLDPTRFDGWVTWGDDALGSRAVIVGDIDPATVVAALDDRDDIGAVEIESYRDVDTVSIRGLETTDDPSVSSSPLDLHVAARDGVVLLAHSGDDLQQMIDRALDGGPTITDAPESASLIAALGDSGRYGFVIWQGADPRFGPQAFGSSARLHEPLQLVASVVRPGSDPDAVAADIESDANSAIALRRSDLPETVRDMAVETDVDMATRVVTSYLLGLTAEELDTITDPAFVEAGTAVMAAVSGRTGPAMLE